MATNDPSQKHGWVWSPSGLVLLAFLAIAAFFLITKHWVHTTPVLPWVVFLGLGLAYTVISEHVNVHVVSRWAYSRWMPTVGGIGLVPLQQWLVVPTLSVRLARRPV